MYLQSTLQRFPDKNNYRRYESGTSVRVIYVSLLMKGRAAGMLIVRERFKSFCVERAGRLGGEHCLAQHCLAPGTASWLRGLAAVPVRLLLLEVQAVGDYFYTFLRQ